MVLLNGLERRVTLVCDWNKSWECGLNLPIVFCKVWKVFLPSTKVAISLTHAWKHELAEFPSEAGSDAQCVVAAEQWYPVWNSQWTCKMSSMTYSSRLKGCFPFWSMPVQSQQLVHTVCNCISISPPLMRSLYSNVYHSAYTALQALFFHPYWQHQTRESGECKLEGRKDTCNIIRQPL